MEAAFEIASAATSSEELGNGVYPPSRRMLEAHGISCAGKTARRIRPDDYAHYDLIIGMDEENRRNLDRFYNGDPDGKIHDLLDYAGRPGEAVSDPWYTRDFQRAWDDIYAGCTGLFDALCGAVTLDMSACRTRKELYAVLRRAMAMGGLVRREPRRPVGCPHGPSAHGGSAFPSSSPMRARPHPCAVMPKG